MTTAEGRSPESRHLMSTNFWKPMSDAEAALGADDIGELQRQAVRDDRRVAVRDVRERPGMDERRSALDGLDEIRLQRVAQDHGHRARDAQVLEGHPRTALILGDDRLADPRSQVGKVGRQREDRHDLRGGRDVELRLALATRLAEPDPDPTQDPVVDVEDARPADRGRVDGEGVAVDQMAVEEGRRQVVRRADGMDVAGEVEVDVLHRQDLAVPAAGAAALDPEHGAEGGLADRDGSAHPDPIEGLREADRRRRLALAERRRRDGRDDDLATVRPIGKAPEGLESDLRLVRPIQLDLVGLQAQLGGELCDRPQACRLGDLEAAGDAHAEAAAGRGGSASS